MAWELATVLCFVGIIAVLAYLYANINNKIVPLRLLFFGGVWWFLIILLSVIVQIITESSPTSTTIISLLNDAVVAGTWLFYAITLLTILSFIYECYNLIQNYVLAKKQAREGFKPV